MSSLANRFILVDDNNIPIIDKSWNKNTKLITYKGKTKTVFQWAKSLGMKRTSLYNRLYVFHWDLKRAMEQPVAKKKRKKTK